MMNNHQINKLAMYLVVLTVLDEFAAFIATIPAFGRLYQSFKQLTVDIGNNSQAVAKGTTGETKAKDKSAVDMASTVAGLVGTLHAYATDTGDQSLMHKSNISETDISGTRNAERANFADSLLDMVEAKKVELADWGVSDSTIADARTSVSNFRSSLGKREAVKTTHVSERDSLESMFVAGDRMLKDQIDRIVDNHSKDKPDLYSRYYAARVIIDVAATRGKADGDNPPQPQQPGSPANN